MFEYETVESPLPIVMGNEEETGMTLRTGEFIDEPYDLADCLPIYIPQAMIGRHDEFLTNGFRIYIGGSESSDKPTNIERSTPECILPVDLNKYIRVGEYIMDSIVEKYVIENSDNEETSIRLQRRVVDSYGNRKGCHDNFGLELDSEAGNSIDLGHHIKHHIATRSFISGAGHVDSHKGLFYAQKIEGLVSSNGYGYMGTIGRIVSDIDSIRLEIRCNDINISDWATQIRLGSMGLVLALDEIGELDQLDDYVGFMGETEYLENTKELNRLRLNNNGELKVSSGQMDALDYQQRVAEIALKSLGIYIDVPLNYHKIAQEIYEYCDDFRKVLSGSDDISLLADRSDWAAKLNLIKLGIEFDRDFGIKRDFLDIKSQAADLKYDYKEVTALNGKIKSKKEGTGYKMRDRGLFRFNIPEKNIQSAKILPPKNTRAVLRSMLISNQNISSCDWKSISFKSRLGQKSPHKIVLAPRDIEFTSEDELKISSIDK